MAPTCKEITTPGTMWSFCPSLAASIIFLVLFALTTCAHIAQAWDHRKPYCWVIIMSGLWQMLAYIFRTMSILSPDSYTKYAVWFALLLLAPLWVNAFVYMVIGRVAWNFIAGASVCRVKAWNIGFLFVVLDIIAFIVQALGASMANGDDLTTADVLDALHIYMGGVGLQQLFIVIFMLLSAKLLIDVRKELVGADRQRATTMLVAVFAVLLLITVRITFRICEFASGLDSSIPNHEAYQYCLDSMPMLLALVVLNVVHPGRLMPGKLSDMPSWRERRRQKKEAEKHLLDALS